MYWRGMTPPTILSTNSKPAPRSVGSTRSHATANCPWPPLCFFTLPSASAVPVIVSRYGTCTSSVSTSTPNLRARRSSAIDRCVSPMPSSSVWCVSGVAVDAQRRVLVDEPVQRVRELVLVALRLRVDRDREERVGRPRTARPRCRCRARRARRRSWCRRAWRPRRCRPACSSFAGSCSLPRIVEIWCRRSSCTVRPFTQRRRRRAARPGAP